MTASVIMVGLFAVSSGKALIHADFSSFFHLHYSFSAAFGSGDVMVIIFRICLSTSRPSGSISALHRNALNMRLLISLLRFLFIYIFIYLFQKTLNQILINLVHLLAVIGKKKSCRWQLT